VDFAFTPRTTVPVEPERDTARAMSKENVEIVVRMLRAWGKGERESAREAYHADVVMIRPIIDSRVTHGLSAMEEANEAWRRSWEDFRLDIEEAFDAGDSVVAIVRQHGVGKDTGAEVELLTYGVFKLRNSKIIRAEFFDSKTAALEAAGLSE
jgi:ketosteroid isomerase-like protein